MGGSESFLFVVIHAGWRLPEQAIASPTSPWVRSAACVTESIWAAWSWLAGPEPLVELRAAVAGEPLGEVMPRHAFLGDDLLKGFSRGAVEVAGRLVGGHPLLAVHQMELPGGARQALGDLGERSRYVGESRSFVTLQGILDLRERPRHLHWRNPLALLFYGHRLPQ